MRSFTSSLALLLLATLFQQSVAAEPAEETNKPSSQRLGELDQQFNKTVTQFGDQAALSAALKKRRADWNALLKSIEAKDPAKMNADDHATAAVLYQRLGLPEEAVPHAEAAVKADGENELYRMLLIYMLVDNKQLDAAETAYSELVAKSPQSRNVKQLHLKLSAAQIAAGSASKGADHLIAYLDADRRDNEQGAYLLRVGQLITALKRADRAKEVPERIDHELAAVREWGTAEPKAPLAPYVSELIARKIQYYAESGKGEEARSLLKTELAAAQKNAEAKPNDTVAAIAVIPLLAARLDVAKDDKQLEAAQVDYLKYLADLAAKHPKSADAMVACLESPAATVTRLMATDRGAAATALMDATKKLIALIKPEGTAAEQAYMMAQDQIGRVMQQLELEQAQSVLLGKDAFPIKPEAWVNGTPLTDEDLKGKVVLLDFWAIWCGPCIATFPHLRHWEEKYADKGLVIIGVTNYYHYGWNAETQTPEPMEGTTPEKEQAMLVEFAKHHELKHRFAIMPEMSDFAEKYGVQGIPQVVVIDRQGKIRLIRVGAGPENAEAIETMLERLLGSGSNPCK